MGVSVAEKLATAFAKRTLIGKISNRVSKLLDWLAKGHAGKLPCSG
jgi:hypothetical protein